MKSEQIAHIKGIITDIYNMSQSITHDELLERAYHYNNEFDYNLSHSELITIVYSITK